MASNGNATGSAISLHLCEAIYIIVVAPAVSDRLGALSFVPCLLAGWDTVQH